MSPLVSIIIPCHNAAPWLQQAVDSALKQTQTGCEVIIVDDGSTDESPGILASMKGPGLITVRQEAAGASAARNKGLRLAHGKYVQFLDADDLLAPDKIELQVRLLDASGPGFVASGEWARFEEDPARAKFEDYPLSRDLTGVEFLQTCSEQQVMMQPGAWLSPRSLLDESGPWDESLSLNDDGEYFARVVLRAKGIRFCQGARAFYRSGNPASLSRRRSRRHLDSYFRSIDLTMSAFLKEDSSPRSLEAASFVWKWCAFELYPSAPDLCAEAERRCAALGGSKRPFPAGPAFNRLSRFLGWKLAKRVRTWISSR